ncbi:MAG: EAL domain-containing protein [Gammaproteobacteria bacterium]
MNTRKTGILALIRKNWQGYIWRILFSITAVLTMAIAQHIFVLKIPFEELTLRLFFIPLLVGTTIGFFYTTIRLLQNEQKKQLIQLAFKEDQLLNEIKQRKEHAKREQRLSYAIKVSQDGLWDWNIKTDKVYYSPRWEQILGYEENSVLFTLDTWRNSLHPDDKKRVLDGLELHLYGQAPDFFDEFRLKNASGNWVWVQGRGQVVEYDDSAAPTRAVGTISDISDRKRIENSLQALLTGTAVTVGKDFFKSLAHTLSDVLNTRFVLLAQLNKSNPDILNPLVVWDSIHSEKCGNCFVTGTPCELTVRDGECFIDSDLQKSFPDDEMLKKLDAESYMGVALKDHEGKVIGVLALVDSYKLVAWKKDLARAILPVFAARASAEIERQNIDSELINQKERAQVTLHSIADAVITTDAGGIIDYMNPVAEKLTGWPIKESIGKQLSEICEGTDAADHPSLYDVIDQCLHNGHSSLAASNLRIRDHQGKVSEIEQSVSAIKNNKNQLSGAVVVFRDVSDTRKMARQMSWQATHDSLTGLVNRREFELQLQQLIDIARQENKNNALLYIDLDQFKVVNDTCGHTAGDELLRQITHIIDDNTRQADTLARLGGDEFGILLRGCDASIAQNTAKKIIQAVQDFRFAWEGKFFHIGASIGVVEITPQTENINAVMKEADIACYAAKDQGRNRIHVYTKDDAFLEQRQVEMHWATRVKQAIEKKDIILFAQEIISLENGYDSHYEILSRMRQDDGTFIMPDSFIPAAERYDVIVDIDKYVVLNVFNLMRDKKIPENITLSINISGNSICDKSFMQFILDYVSEIKLKTDNICFEITETAAIANFAKALEFIDALREVGFQFSLDNFGSGVSSFGYLKQLPIDYLKIDGFFVKDMVSDPIDAAMVSAINEIGHRMGIKTIAEFVESEEILQDLRKLGVNYAQGYHINKPQLLSEVFLA